ncbi:glycoside hydrolase family 28 protein [Burkholderia glumae]|uniref:glycoside hydrolase family 28 protein n=1 Tax=Burkholderia glumae TaxID=337 RepID=UPI000314AC38|nr:glycosyl hydrolase family 28 protein [Burkholderia glumae]MCM2494972.1 glycosyl hydrolase family 28 protein [Burkholderia glumae]MCM2545837.1 glycosyl hydrolase family 28 protein [Burkholderia glumae]PJO22510.1 endopolygalacturonase [Burkholderia glumae AU6208]QHE13694.1 endopolygalacturonase [Burkholderia glumae AU6208]
MGPSSRTRAPRLLCLLAAALATAAALGACGGDADTPAVATGTGTPSVANGVFQVGTTISDANLPAEPSLPTDAQVCSTLEASNTLVSRPDGSLPPEADPSVAGVGKAVSPATANPDQARIQAALDACGAAVDAQVGAAIAAADASATAAQKAAAVANVNISGASGEELAKPAYRASKFAVRLVVSSSGAGNGFISGPLTLPSGVTLWIDKGVTLYASRDVKAYAPTAAGPYCANTAVSAVSATKAGSSSNCLALITGTNLVNSAVVGDGRIDGRGYAEIVTSDAKYPLMKVDLTCSNTYAAYKTGTVAPDGTPCDDGGTVVDSKSSVRNMSWWDLAYLGNMVQNGTTGTASQSNFRLMVFNYAKNLTLYRITLNNSPNFHVVPSGVDGLTVWGVKVQTPTLAAFANPAGNGNPLYTGQTFGEDNVKNTDAFDPGSASKATSAALSTGSTTNSAAGAISFDGYLKNFVFAYNYVSTGDDDIALKGSSNPSPAGSGLFGVDGNRNVRADRKWGIVIAHNHIYWGHGISIGSETNAGVTNVQVYDNSFWDSEEGLRIKSDYARGGEVSNIHYANICIRDATNALLFTPYYSTKALPASGPLYPNFHDISISNVVITGSAGVKLQGFEANTGGFGEPAFPLVMTLTNVLADSPDNISVISSDANLTLQNVNLPIFASAANRVVLNGAANHALTSSGVLDCSKAFVDFPGIDQSNPFGTTWAPSL